MISQLFCLKGKIQKENFNDHQTLMEKMSNGLERLIFAFAIFLENLKMIITCKSILCVAL